MALTDKWTKKFEQILAEGMCVLIDAILSIKKNNHEPILLTVSRRMPHVLFWYKYALATEEQRKILEETEVITEIALPFIDFHPKGKELDIIIVDDVVSTGHTIEYIIQLTKDVSGLDNIPVFVFYADKSSSSLEDSSKAITVFHNVNDTQEKARLRDFISTIIAATLPIDVTYPMLYVDCADRSLSIEDVKELVKDTRSKPIDNYKVIIDYETGLTTVSPCRAIEKGKQNISYTSLLPSEISNSLNNDFAKIRVYDRMGELVVVPYAPNILSDIDLSNRDLFECKEYKEIWNIVLSYITPDESKPKESTKDDIISRERVVNRRHRSLVVMANYLYSLSSYNRILNVRENIDDLRVDVKLEDLSLIAGDHLAEIILPKVEHILSKRLVSPRIHKKFKVADTLVPDVYLSDYDFSKLMVIDEEDLQRDLISIFRNAILKKEEYIAITPDELEYSVEGIMESFESLEKTLLIKSYEKKVEVNKWVDEMIDKGRIVSRYANVKGTDRNRYWRRFFRLSSSLEHS